MRHCLLVLFLLCSAYTPARAVDEIQGVTAVWRDFVASIRRGDYRNAHGLFSAQSRGALPYAEFVQEYGPLSAAREMVLARPESQATDLDDDWAEITYGGTHPGTGRKFKVGVAFVKNEGGWGLVAARNEMTERVEAGARSILRMLWNAREQAPAGELVAAMNRAQAESPILRFYRLETDGKTFRAFPQERGLRTFYVDSWGMVKAMEKAQPPSPKPAQVVVPKASALPQPEPAKREPAKKNRDEMGELSEPPMPGQKNGAVGRKGSRMGPGDELPEPPMRRSGDGKTPPVVSLPDMIR